MQQLNLQEIETAVNQYGEIVVSKNSKNKVVVMSMEEYKKKMFEDKIERKLLKAEKQIEEGKTVKATEVFKELKELYGF
jgi:prevent-host-death family protein